ncbi:TIGR04282 family arsenosugar biosynthesis glycosyltransferase [Rhodovulum sp. DZ06]|uniref:TIGR04282 family arsenosugar biosynthesis glycosyltransferase n=1 Tax=Rhodovulum sp. DZ06 TaxID=3425126 RepID=UPI003D350603
MSGAEARRLRLLVMVKEPRPGRVKTRLARGIGKVPAAWWFRRQLAQTLRRLGRDPRWELILFVSPHGAEASRAFPGGFRRMAQGSGDLGARMARGLREAPPGPVLLMGGDIPRVTRAQIAASFKALEGAEALFAPAGDGGFWLVGLKRGGAAPPRGLFRDCRWSTEHALADAEASAAPLRIARGPLMRDVDEASDLPPRDWR